MAKMKEKDGQDKESVSPASGQGLQLLRLLTVEREGMEFWEDGDDIVSVWTASEDYQSWTDTVHGGIQATLLDEVGGWYVTRKLQTAGVTSNLDIRYRKTVPIGKPLEIRVRLKEMRRNLAVMEGCIRCEGKVCTTAEITYFTVSQEKAREQFFFSGCELEKD